MSKKFFIGLILFFGVLPAFAKFVQDDQAPGLTLFFRRHYDIDKNYGFSSVTEAAIRINDEATLSRDSVRVITFNPKFFKTRILSAKVINEGVEQNVDSDQIILKDAESEVSTAFDSQKSWIINYPNVKVGSVLYYKMQQETLPTEGDANFFYFAESGGAYANEWNVTIESVQPLESFIKDEKNLFDFTQAKVNGKYLYGLKNRKPIRNYVVGEDNVYDRSARFPYLILSSAKEWSTFNPKMRKKYLSIEKQELPPKLSSMVASLDKEKLQYVKVQKLLNLLMPKFRYFSDMRRINGENIPRSLADIETSGYADCKDISIFISAALHKMGIKSNVALVWRGTNDVPEAESFQLATEAVYNHAVVRAILDGKEYWIDGTNRIVYFETPHPDISGRKALLVDEASFILTEVPKFSSNFAKYEEVMEFSFDPLPHGPKDSNKSKGVHAKSRQKSFDYVAYRTYQDDLLLQDGIRDLNLIRSVSGVMNYSNPKVKVETSNFDLKHEVEVQVEVDLESYGFRTSAGFGFTLPQSNRMGRIMFNTKERDSDLFLLYPIEVNTKNILHNKKIVGQRSLECNVVSPWLDFRRKIISKAKQVEVVDFLKTKVSYIPNEDIKTELFSKTQNEIDRCQNSALILKDVN